MNIQIWESSELEGPVDMNSYTLSSFEFQDDTITTLRNINDTYVAQMKDNGNGLKIELADKKIKLEYHEAVELLFLLMSNMDQSFEFREEKTIKKF
jgi:hypothetical protein